MGPIAETPEQPLELILARNLISIMSFPGMLVDAEGAIVFYNDAAAEIFGSRFEETGRIPLASWRAEVGPFDERGNRLTSDNLPVTVALRDSRPGYGRFQVRSATAGLVAIEATALPLVGQTGRHGALVVFWPLDAEHAWPLGTRGR